MIEYALIAVLVILGIVFMGPYVLRSVNAHFKLWDEGVQDSFTENLTQAPVSIIPNITTNCVCTDSDGGCGSSTSLQCGANQRIYNHTCIPVDSQCDGEPTFKCVNDDSCCTTYFPQSCGTVPCPAGGCSGAPTSPPPAPNNCYYGQRIYATQCSDLPVQCNTDSACDPLCRGILSRGALYCATNSTTAPTSLLQTYGISYVATCPSNPTCQVYCTFPYILNSTGTGCLDTYIVAPYLGPNTRNDVPFTPICAPSGATLTVRSQTPQAQCGNPGTPSTQCTINFTY